MRDWEATLIESLGLDEADLHRLALALAVAERRGALPASLRVGGERPQEGAPAEDLLGGADAAAEALAHLARDEDIPRLVARGLGLLDALASRGRDGPWSMFEELARALGGSRPAEKAGELAVPVARTGDGRVLRWTINAEGGGQGAPHAGIAGQTGQGKSQLLMQVLAGVARRSPGTGLLVLDYKGDLSRNDRFLEATGLKPIRPGREPLPVNPFHLAEDIAPRLAARALTEVLAWASRGGLGDVQRGRAARAMQRVYEEHGMKPSLDAVREAIRRQYEEEGGREDKVLSAVETLTGTRIFADRPDLAPEAFLEGRWLVELRNLPGMEVLFALVLMNWVHEFVRSAADAPKVNEKGPPPRTLRRLRTVIAVDEAHYYLKGRPQPLLELVRVGRSKGVAVILSTQSVADFKDHDVLTEQLPTLFLFRHQVAPPTNLLQGVLGLRSTEEARRARDLVLNLEQFEVLTTAGGAERLEPVRVLPFYENLGEVGGTHG